MPLDGFHQQKNLPTISQGLPTLNSMQKANVLKMFTKRYEDVWTFVERLDFKNVLCFLYKVFHIPSPVVQPQTNS